MQDQDIKLPFVKVVSAWLTAVAASTWQTFSELPWDVLAQFAAFVYSCALIYEWLHKKFMRRDSHGSN
jgi:hypothetical protein